MRAALSLDGTWQFRLDPDDRGLSESWQAPGTSFDRELPVPLPWQAADPALRQYAGAAWYKRTLELPADWSGQSIALRFGAVDYEARVWVNGAEVGGHVGGYTPFELEVTNAVRPGRNEVVLRVFDPPDVAEIPHGKQGGRWYTAVSGPWQSIQLLARPRTRVERVEVQADHHGTVRARVYCAGLDTPTPVTLEILDGDDIVATAAAFAPPTIDLPPQPPTPNPQSPALVDLAVPQPRPWSPDAPHLYTLRARLGDDVLDQPIGLRTIEARNGQVLLNGEPLYMRGALDQAYWPDTLYTVPSDEEIEREIRLAKELGLNLLRKHIKPEDPRYLDACDRLGMLIWAEPANPMRFTAGAREALRRDLLEMVARDFNRPSVLIWSLYNEDWGVPELFHDADQQEWVAALYGELKRRDPTRLVCDNSGWAHVVTDLNDYHEYYTAPERIRRFEARLDALLADPDENFVLGRRSRGEPIHVSEFGNWGVPDPALARERSGGEPAWFNYDQSYASPTASPTPITQPPTPNPTDRMKVVRGFEERFREVGLDRVFGQPSDLNAFLQRRAARALRAQIEAMRVRPAIRGYVVTEMTDIEWEGNGWLDYWRQPKVWHRDLAEMNAPLALIARPERPTYWGGESVVVRLHVANDTARAIEGRVRWRLEGTSIGGELPASVPPKTVVQLPDAARFAAPADAPRLAELRVELVEGADVLARTHADLAFAPRSAARVDAASPLATSNPRLGAIGLDRLFRQRLERHGFRMRGPWRQAPAIVAQALDPDVWSYLESGGRVLYVVGPGAVGADLAGLRFFALPAAESWRMAAGAAWARPSRLAPAPIAPDLGWEVESIFPHLVIEQESIQPDDEVLAGWLEGWIANTGALALSRRVGAGRLIATTFRFEDPYGLDPVATLLLNRLLALLAE